MKRLLRVNEFAAMAGVTVRALHHYDRLNLLKPKRNESGYRLYSVRDLERLEHIVTLKFLGIPLRQIKDMLERDGTNLLETLEGQRLALEKKRELVEQAIRWIREAERSVRRDGVPETAALKKIIEVIEMQNNADFMKRYYSDAAQAKLAERRREWNPELQAQATQAWTDLFRDVEAAIEDRTDPASERAQGLASRWKQLVSEFTGGDAEVSEGLKRAWADRQEWPSDMQQKTQKFSNPKVWQFIGKAMNCG